MGVEDETMTETMANAFVYGSMAGLALGLIFIAVALIANGD